MNILPLPNEGSDIRGKHGGDKQTLKGRFHDSPGHQFGDDILDNEDALDFSYKGASGAIMPIGNVDDFESHQEQKEKPLLAKQKKGKWSGKGESLTTENAIEFMLHERAQLDAEASALRRENEKLRMNLERQQYGAPILANTDQQQPPVDLSAWKEQMEKLKLENEALKGLALQKNVDPEALAKLRIMGSPPPMPPTEQQKIMMLQTATGSPLVQRGPLLKPAVSSPSPEIPIPISSLVWDGGYLWKIPYNGKGVPERRIVAIKRAAMPGPFAKSVVVQRKSGPNAGSGGDAPRQQYIYFPPTLVWYNSEKPGEIKNARELVVYEGAHVVVGHNTSAFWKLASREGPLPRPELCFSVVTSSRSLDLAAEKKSDAHDWINALHQLLVSLNPNSEWAQKNLKQDKPVFVNALEKSPALDKTKKASNASDNRTSKGPVASPPRTQAQPPLPPASQNESRKIAIKKQLFAAVKAGDADMLQGMLKARVPVNTMDGALSDTPLIYACRLDKPDIVKICLDFGAKNDPHPDFGDTALHVAVAAGHHKCADVILEAAAQSEADDIISNLTNEEGQTPLHVAAAKGHGELVELLMEHGAEIGRTDQLDQTVLHVCSAAGHKVCLAMLLDLGGDHLLEAPDLGGNTALHHAALNGRLAVLRLLLETAADVTAKNTMGQTAYNLATQHGHHQISMLLLEYMEYHNAASLPSAKQQQSRSIAPSISIDTDDLYENPLENDNYVGEEFSMELGDIPPSPKHGKEPHAFHHQEWNVTTSNADLPRPHQAQSPAQLHTKNQLAAAASPLQSRSQSQMSTPPSQSMGDYRVLQKGSANRYQLAGQSSQSSHVLNPQSQHPMSARELGYPATTATDYYSPISARERPAPNMFDGMQVNYSQAPYPIQYQQMQQQPMQQQGIYQPMQVPMINAMQAYSPVQVQPPLPVYQQPYEQPYQQAYQQPYQQPYQGQHAGPMMRTNSYVPPPISIVAANSDWVQAHSDPHPTQQSRHSYGGYEAASVENTVETFYAHDMHWSVYETEDGHTYYLDSATSHSQWEDPRVAGLVYVDYGTAQTGSQLDSPVRPDAKSSSHNGRSMPYSDYRLQSPPKCPSPKASWTRDKAESKASAFFPSDDEDEKIDLSVKRDLRFGGDDDDEEEIAAKQERAEPFTKPRGAQPVSSQYAKQPTARPRFRSDISSDSDSDEASPSTPHIRPKVAAAARPKHVPAPMPVEASRVAPTLVEQPPPSLPKQKPQEPQQTQPAARRIVTALELSPAGPPPPATSEHPAAAPSRLFPTSPLDHRAEGKESDERVDRKAAGAKLGALFASQLGLTVHTSDANTSKGPSQPAVAEHKETAVLSQGAGSKIPQAESKQQNQIPARESVSPSARIAKYTNLLRSGATLRAVRREMENENESRSVISRVLELADTITVDSFAASAASSAHVVDAPPPINEAGPRGCETTEDLSELKSDAVLGKYAKMAAMGVPHGSVQAKMKLDGIEENQANRLLRALGIAVAGPPPALAPVQKEDLSELKSDAVLGKYAKMAAMGVPHGSVQAKMKLDGIEENQANRLLRALGAGPEESAAPASSAGPRPKSILSALAAGPGGLRGSAPPASRRSTVQMQNIHWNPVPEDRLKRSVWGSAEGIDKEDIQDSDLEELEKLFGASQNGPGDAKSRRSVANGASSSSSGGDSNAKKGLKLHMLDGKRAQNIVIGLAQYKSITTDHFALLRAICGLDNMGGRISADHLENLLPLLPSGPEMKCLADLAGSTHPAEVFIRAAASFYPELPKRLSCFLTCCHFRGNVAAATDKAKLLVSACKEVISSDKLARLLQKMLAVGNVMNQGTYRGQANGFTVDSLLKMIQTKGTDKKTTIVDYVVKSLFDRKEERLLDVIEDLQVIDEAARLNCADSLKEMEDLRKAFGGLQEELGRLRDRQAKGDALSPQQSASNSNSPKKSMSTAFIEALSQYVDAFASAMEEMDRAKTAMVRNVDEVIEYFGESASCSTSDIFSVLQQFRKALTAAKEVVERKERMARSQLRRSQSPPRR